MNNLPWERCGLLVAAAGAGARFGGFKQIAQIARKPVIAHTLGAFAEVPFAERVVVLPEPFIKDRVWKGIADGFQELQVFEAVAGGDSRSQSVLNGLKKLSPACEFVAVHDGARPLPPIETMRRCFEMLVRDSKLAGVIVASPLVDTVKQVEQDDASIRSTLDRNLLRKAETPQVCRRQWLEEALASEAGQVATDEAQCLELAGHRTACLVHDGFNPKITLPHDTALVSAYLNSKE